MILAVTALMLALTRAEIIERFKAPTLTKVNGLIEVVADCPEDMRREYQGPVSNFASEICKHLYMAGNVREKTFLKPGILIFVGDSKTNNTTVVSSAKRRKDGSEYMRIYLPSPAYSNLDRLRTEVVKGYALAVLGQTLDDKGAVKLLRSAFPRLKADDEYAELAKWREGELDGHDDEYFLKLERTIITPGEAREKDVLDFAAKLRFYPGNICVPFCNKYPVLDYREAIPLAKEDIRIRLEAANSFSKVVVYGGGRGVALADASQAYSKFLRELAAYKLSEEELGELLDEADKLLAIALEEARDNNKNTL